MHCFRSNFQQLQTNCVDPLFPHTCGQGQSPKPIKQVIGEYMYLQSVCINNHRVRTHGREIESALTFLNEVFHLAPTAVKPDNLIRLQIFHRCDNEGEQVHHLPIGFLHFEDHSSRMRPTAGLIIKLTVFNGIIDLVLPGCPVKCFLCILCIPDQSRILFQADRVFTVVFFTDLIQIRRGYFVRYSCSSGIMKAAASLLQY